MGLQAILDAIQASGEAQAREIEISAQAKVREILAEARSEARRLRKEAREASAAPATEEQARILHQARFEALQTVGTVCKELVDATLCQARRRLANIRMESIYHTVLLQLTEEALIALNGSLIETGQTRLEVDPRDRELLESILRDLRLRFPVDDVLNCQGGLIARSNDGRVVVNNTLEARLERATPDLRNQLAALFEDGQPENQEAEDRRRTNQCLVMTMETPAFGS